MEHLGLATRVAKRAWNGGHRKKGHRNNASSAATGVEQEGGPVSDAVEKSGTGSLLGIGADCSTIKDAEQHASKVALTRLNLLPRA